MKQRLTEGDTYDDLTEAADRPPPPWINEDVVTKQWEGRRENAIKAMREQMTYQFVMLLSGFTNEKMSKYWSRKENASGKKMAQCNINTDEDYDCGSTTDAKKYHDWYINTSWADGMIYLTPMVYGHMEEALTALTQRFDHLRNAKLEFRGPGWRHRPARTSSRTRPGPGSGVATRGGPGRQGRCPGRGPGARAFRSESTRDARRGGEPRRRTASRGEPASRESPRGELRAPGRAIRRRGARGGVHRARLLPSDRGGGGDEVQKHDDNS